MSVIVDFETRSKCDLTKAGTDKYANHPSTDLICLCAVSLETDQQWVWTPEVGKLPPNLVKAIEAGEFIIAHHARFDQAIWEYIAVDRYDFPVLTTDQWYCSMAQARVNALPAGLDRVTRALDSEFKKDAGEGKRLIQKYSIPDKNTGEFRPMGSAGRLKMVTYCMGDVLATKDMVLNTRMMTRTEHNDWLVNERINDMGVRIDLPLAKAAKEHAEIEAGELSCQITALTRNVITKATQTKRISDWVLPKLCPEALRLTVDYTKKSGHSLGKDVLAQLIERADEFDIAPTELAILGVRRDGSSSSVAKYTRMIDMADSDGRVRGSFNYAGAATLRYTSKGLQLHNFKRNCLSVAEVEGMRPTLLMGHRLNQNVMETLGKMLRPTLIPAPGKVFVIGDWSSIENMGLPWLSDDDRARAKLDRFADGEDMYVAAAADAGIDDRQVGKVIELSLGFGGGPKAFRAMGKNYGVYLLESEEIRIVRNWRKKNIWAPVFWRKLERAVRRAYNRPGLNHSAGRVSYQYYPKLMGGSMLCALPNGQQITYPQFRLEDGDMTALKANWTPAGDDTEWPRYKLYGGLLSENVTQATCACLLREAVSQLKHVVMHVHDEIVLEVNEDEAYYWRSHLQSIMETNPRWATGLPLKAKPIITTRYGK